MGQFSPVSSDRFIRETKCLFFSNLPTALTADSYLTTRLACATPIVHLLLHSFRLPEDDKWVWAPASNGKAEPPATPGL